MVDAFCPGHLADVDQALDAWFKLYEGTVAHDVNDSTRVLLVDVVALINRFPRILRKLFESKCNLLLFAVNMQDLDFDLLINLDHFRWMADSFPAHIRDMQQAVDTTKVNERTEFGDILDNALACLTNFQVSQQCVAIFFALLLDKRPAANNDISSRFVDF